MCAEQQHHVRTAKKKKHNRRKQQGRMRGWILSYVCVFVSSLSSARPWGTTGGQQQPADESSRIPSSLPLSHIPGFMSIFMCIMDVDILIWMYVSRYIYIYLKRVDVSSSCVFLVAAVEAGRTSRNLIRWRCPVSWRMMGKFLTCCCSSPISDWSVIDQWLISSCSDWWQGLTRQTEDLISSQLWLADDPTVGLTSSSGAASAAAAAATPSLRPTETERKRNNERWWRRWREMKEADRDGLMER